MYVADFFKSKRIRIFAIQVYNCAKFEVQSLPIDSVPKL